MGPRIDTERLMLRLPEMADAENISRYCGEFDVARMTSRIPHPYPVLAAELWVLQTRAAWRENFAHGKREYKESRKRAFLEREET